MPVYLNNKPEIMSIADVAICLGVKEATVRSLVKNKMIKAIKVGRLIKITRESLIQYIEMNTI